MPVSLALTTEVFVGSSILLSRALHPTSSILHELQRLVGIILLCHGLYQTLRPKKPTAAELIAKNTSTTNWGANHPIAMTPDSMIDLMTKLKVPPATKNKSGDKSGAATSTTTKVQTSSSSSTSSVTSSYFTRTPSTPSAPSNSTITPNNTPSNASKPAPIPSPLLSLTSPSSIRGSPHLSTPTQLLDFTNNTNNSPFSPSQTLKTQSTEKPRKYTYARDSPQSSTGSSKHSTPLPPVNPLSSNIQTGLPSSSPLQPPPTSLNPTLLTKLGPNGPRIQVLCDVYRSGGCEREKFVIIINEWAGGMAGEVLRDQRVF